MRIFFADSQIVLLQTEKAIPVLGQLVGMRRQAGDWFTLGTCRLRAGELNAAMEAARRAIQIRPDLPSHHALLAEIYKQSNQPDLAQHEEQIEQWLKAAVPNSGNRSGLK